MITAFNILVARRGSFLSAAWGRRKRRKRRRNKPSSDKPFQEKEEKIKTRRGPFKRGSRPSPENDVRLGVDGQSGELFGFRLLRLTLFWEI